MEIKPPKVIRKFDGIYLKPKPNYKTTGSFWVSKGTFNISLPSYYEKYSD